MELICTHTPAKIQHFYKTLHEIFGHPFSLRTPESLLTWMVTSPPSLCPSTSTISSVTIFIFFPFSSSFLLLLLHHHHHQYHRHHHCHHQHSHHTIIIIISSPLASWTLSWPSWYMWTHVSHVTTLSGHYLLGSSCNLWGNGGTEVLSELSMIASLISSRGRIQNQATWHSVHIPTSYRGWEMCPWWFLIPELGRGKEGQQLPAPPTWASAWRWFPLLSGAPWSFMFSSNGLGTCPWQLMKLDNLFLYFKDGGSLEDKVAMGLRRKDWECAHCFNKWAEGTVVSQPEDLRWLMGKWCATCHGGVIPHGPRPLSCLSTLAQSFSISSFPGTSHL